MCVFQPSHKQIMSSMWTDRRHASWECRVKDVLMWQNSWKKIVILKILTHSGHITKQKSLKTLILGKYGAGRCGRYSHDTDLLLILNALPNFFNWWFATLHGLWLCGLWLCGQFIYYLNYLFIRQICGTNLSAVEEIWIVTL